MYVLCITDINKGVDYRLYRAVTGPRILGGRVSQISRQSAHEGGKVVRPHRRYHYYSFTVEAESSPGPLYTQKDYVNEEFQ